MNRLLLAGAVLTIAACDPSLGPFPSPSNGPTPDVAVEQPQQTTLVATVADDYSVGALASVDLDTREVDDLLASISGDPVLVSDGGMIFLLNRHNWDSIRVSARSLERAASRVFRRFGSVDRTFRR